MPCYLFTFHAYRTWMPDRPRGYVRRDEGALEPDEEMARRYEKKAKHSAIVFGEEIQESLINAAREAAVRQEFRLHCIATEPTHVHLLVSWPDDRPWKRMRSGLRQSLTRHLNRVFGATDCAADGPRECEGGSRDRPQAGLPAATGSGAQGVERRPRRPWFSRGGSRKRVRNRRHFDYLIGEYLPSHRGAFWREDQQ